MPKQTKVNSKKTTGLIKIGKISDFNTITKYCKKEGLIIGKWVAATCLEKIKNIK